MANLLRLGVNIDHVATVRNARGSAWPDPLRAALVAETAGADGITAHLREDRRHIRDRDIEALMAALTVPLNFECAATAEMQAIALTRRRVNPHAGRTAAHERGVGFQRIGHVFQFPAQFDQQAITLVAVKELVLFKDVIKAAHSSHLARRFALVHRR